MCAFLVTHTRAHTPPTPVFECLAVFSYDLQVSRTEPWKKGVVCFAVFNCTTKGGEKRYLYRGRIVAEPGDQVDVRWEADRLVKTHSNADAHASKLAAWAAVMKKDSARCPTKDVPQHASNEEVSDSRNQEATPAPAFVKIGKKHFPVPATYGGRLKFDQEPCDDMLTICKSHTHKEIVACMSNPVKAKAKAASDKSKENAAFVRVFASWL